jgi:hypothetical protein
MDNTLCKYTAMRGTVLYRKQLSAIAVLGRLYNYCYASLVMVNRW